MLRPSPPKGVPAVAPSPPEAEDDRPTLVPEFDPTAFARASENRQRAAIEGGESTIDQAERLHAAGDHDRALFLVTRLLEIAPSHAEAKQLAAACDAALERQWLEALGSEAGVLVAAVELHELTSYALDNVSAFLLSRIDGAATVEELLDISGLPRQVALRHLGNLKSRGIIGVVGEAPPSTVEEDCQVESGVLPVAAGLPRVDAIAMLLAGADEIDRLDLEPQERRILSLVNDQRTVEQILVAAQVDLVDGTLLFERLAEEGLVTFA